jgi:tetratricopeptide (TPR) repeat protein
MNVSFVPLLAASLLGGACAFSRPVPADVRVPPDLLRGSAYTAGGEPSRSRYVVRMTDGQRDWEIQLPEIATAYSVSVPLQGTSTSPVGVDLATTTAADREILAERAAAARSSGDLTEVDPDDRRRGVVPAKDEEDDAEPAKADANGKMKATKRPAAAAAAGGQTGERAVPRSSYLLTLARVKDLYRTRHYELALVEIVELERQYPGDERILSMKGSLYERMGNKNLARDAWQQVLALNPFNLAVLEALQRLGK